MASSSDRPKAPPPPVLAIWLTSNLPREGRPSPRAALASTRRGGSRRCARWRCSLALGRGVSRRRWLPVDHAHDQRERIVLPGAPAFSSVGAHPPRRPFPRPRAPRRLHHPEHHERADPRPARGGRASHRAGLPVDHARGLCDGSPDGPSWSPAATPPPSGPRRERSDRRGGGGSAPPSAR